MKRTATGRTGQDRTALNAPELTLKTKAAP